MDAATIASICNLLMFYFIGGKKYRACLKVFQLFTDQHILELNLCTKHYTHVFFQVGFITHIPVRSVLHWKAILFDACIVFITICHDMDVRYGKLQNLAATVTRHKSIAREDQRPDFSKLASCLLRVRLEHVRVRGCWHLLQLLHRVRMCSLTSEMLAEAAASVLRYLERKHSVGRALNLQALCDSAMLRLHGLRGSMEELPFLRSVLQHHFQGNVPHFFVQASYRSRRRLDVAPSPTLQRLCVTCPYPPP